MITPSVLDNTNTCNLETKFFLQAEYEGKTIHELAGAGDVEAVAKLLGAGHPLDERDDSNCTALHFAADRGRSEVVDLLLDAGAVNVKLIQRIQTTLQNSHLCILFFCCSLMCHLGEDDHI
jgi:ankyrin repeat protein